MDCIPAFNLSALCLLPSSDSRCKRLIGGVRDYAIFLPDPSGLAMSRNKGAERTKGYAPEEVIGRPCPIFYTPEDFITDVPAQNPRTAELNGSYCGDGRRIRCCPTSLTGLMLVKKHLC